MKKTHRILPALLALSLLCACSGGQSAASPSAASPAASSSAAPSDGSASQAEGVTYPIAGAQGITLSYWCAINSSATNYITNFSETEVWPEVMRRTGVSLKFIHPANGQEQEQFNILMASGDLPDIISEIERYAGGEYKGVSDGAFMDIAELVKTYAPDYCREANKDAERRRELYSEDNKLAGFYRINEDPLPQVTRPILRADWLEEFGMAEPVTLGQFEEYMKNVKEKKGVTPFILNLDGDNGDTWYGAFDMLQSWFVDNGTVHYGKTDARLRDALTWLAGIYQKGYISKDFPAIDGDQIKAEFGSGNTGMYANSVDNARGAVLDLDIEITSTRLPRQREDQLVHTGIASWPKGGNGAAISTACKYPEIAAQFLNYAFTDEGQMLYNYGIEGSTYNMVDGKPQYTDHMLNNEKFPTEAANYILRIHFAPKLQVGTPLEFNPTIAKSPEAVAFRMKGCDDPNVDNAYRFPPLALPEEENNERAAIMSNVNTYADEMILKYITGAESLNTFDDFLAQCDSYGMSRALEITQQAYDRYMSR